MVLDGRGPFERDKGQISGEDMEHHLMVATEILMFGMAGQGTGPAGSKGANSAAETIQPLRSPGTVIRARGTRLAVVIGSI